MQQPGIISALVGARNRKQVDDNVRALDFKLSPAESDAINLKLKDLIITV